jgi:hypothetical protein
MGEKPVPPPRTKQMSEEISSKPTMAGRRTNSSGLRLMPLTNMNKTTGAGSIVSQAKQELQQAANDDLVKKLGHQTTVGKLNPMQVRK